MSGFEFKSVNGNVICTGGNFEYKRVGHLSVFKQTGKIPSIRVVKTIIKDLEYLSGVKL